MYTLKQFSKYTNYKIKDATIDNLDFINISYNMNFLRELFNIFSNKYFLQNKSR